MRLIDVQPVLDYSHNKNIRVCTVDLLEALPVVDAAPVVRGEWVKSDDYKGWLVCSACHDCYVDNAWVNGKKWRYCPNCGARMEDKPCG